MLKLFKTLKNSIHRYHVDQKGSMPLAILMSVFIISSSLLIASTTSLQVLNNRNESVQRQAAWALDSTANLAAETMGTASRSLADLPTTPPPVWYASDDGTYVYRWWIEGTVGVLAAAAGYNHSCAINSDRTVDCWGAGGAGRLGNGTDTSSGYPVPVTGIDNATQITAGIDSTCVLLSTGSIKCWGSGSAGQLGNGGTANSNIPVTVSGITNAIQISGGRNNYCAVLSTGTIKCWGEGTVGQLGDGSASNQSTPVTVSGITNAVKVAQGGFHACAILTGGSVKCWGSNSAYQLGDGTTTQRSTPVTVSGIFDAVDIDAGQRTASQGGDGFTCLVTVSGGNQLKCWGNDTYGQLGDGTTGGTITSPTNVAGVNNVTKVVTGAINTCALNSSGTVQCWGYGPYGTIGNGSLTTSPTPKTVSSIGATISLADFSAITAGAVTDDGKLYMWGYNPSGQTGNGGTTDISTPAAVLTLGPYALTPTAKMQIKLKSLAAAGLTSDSATFQAATSYVWNPATNSWDTIAYYSQY